MFKCTCCGKEFEESVKVYCREGEWDRPYEVCPNCGGVFEEFEGKCCGTCVSYFNRWCEEFDEPVQPEDVCSAWEWEVQN